MTTDTTDLEPIHRKNAMVSPRSGAVAENPGGRRSNAGRKPDLWKRMFDKSLSTVVTQEEADAVIRAMVDQAKQGNIQAANALLDRMLGKVKEKVEVSGNTGVAIQVNVVWPQDKPLP